MPMMMTTITAITAITIQSIVLPPMFFAYSFNELNKLHKLNELNKLTLSLSKLKGIAQKRKHISGGLRLRGFYLAQYLVQLSAVKPDTITLGTTVDERFRFLSEP